MKKPILSVIVVVVSSFIMGLFAATFSPHWKGEPGTFNFEGATPMAAKESPVVSIVNYFVSGRHAVNAYLGSLSSAQRVRFQGVMELARSLTVRVTVIVKRSGKYTVGQKATGILVDGRKTIVTAGHLGDRERALEVWVTTSDGARLRAHILSRDYSVLEESSHDWAIIEIDSPLKPDGEKIPLRVPEVGALVIAAGFPGRLGVNARGQVASSDANEALSPLFTVARVESVSPLHLSPVAGSVPLGGMSGGPILGLDGSLNGIFVSVRDSHSKDAISFSYGGTSVAAFAKALNTPESDH